MDIIRKTTWSAFRDWLQGYFDQDARRRQQLIFRGHRDARWSLSTTLDRSYKFSNDAERKRFTDELIEEFRRELMQVESHGAEELQGVAMELLARHQGLPSPLMDWTESPYIAAFFALANRGKQNGKEAAIWMLDRAKLKQVPAVETIDDYSLLRFNRRAVRQRGVFLRLATGVGLEELLSDALTKLVIPGRAFRAALAELDEMTINATYLFADMEGAARTAHFRVDARRDV
jgi:FRG domain